METTLDLFQDFQIGENVLQNALIEISASSGSMTQQIAIYLRTLSLLNLPPMITLLVRKIVLVMKCISLLMENVSTTSNPNQCGSPAMIISSTRTIVMMLLTQQQWSSQEVLVQVMFQFKIQMLCTLCYSVEKIGSCEFCQ